MKSALTAVVSLAVITGISYKTARSAQLVLPDGKGDRIKTAGVSAASATVPITYHGGPVMLGQVNIYYIWYGNWSGNSANTILTDFANNIGGSPYFSINAGYSQSSPQQFVSGNVHYSGSIVDSYSQGMSLTDASVQTIVSSAIASSALPNDANGVYFVLASADVDETSGFCTTYCGWHRFGTISNSNIKYSFVGNSDRCPSACERQASVSPNGNTGADGMASIIAHELSESVTDPNLNAWFDANGDENADKCAWNFGTTQTAPNGSIYNVLLGGRQYLIQQMWLVTGGCALSAPTALYPPSNPTVTVH